MITIEIKIRVSQPAGINTQKKFSVYVGELSLGDFWEKDLPPLNQLVSLGLEGVAKSIAK